MANERSRGKDLRRLAQMLRALMEGNELDASTASAKFAINPDPARRNLNLLMEEIPGVRKRSGRRPHVFYFDHEAALGSDLARDSRASIAEAIASSFGAAFSRVFGGTDYQTQLNSLRGRVVDRLISFRKKQFENIGRKIVVICGQEELLGDKQGVLDNLIEALLSQRRIKFRYRTFQGDEYEREISPYSLLVYDAHLYVFGLRGKAFRSYRFARMFDVQVTGETFRYPEPNEYDPDIVFRDSIGIWSGDPPGCRLVVRLGAQWAVYAKHHRWHPSQKVLAEHSDGTVDVELFCRPCPEFEQWVLRFGEDAQVLEPPEVRQKIAARLEKARRLYR